MAVPGQPRLHAFGMLLGLYQLFQQWFQIENQMNLFHQISPASEIYLMNHYYVRPYWIECWPLQVKRKLNCCGLNCLENLFSKWTTLGFAWKVEIYLMSIYLGLEKFDRPPTKKNTTKYSKNVAFCIARKKSFNSFIVQWVSLFLSFVSVSTPTHDRLNLVQLTW